VTILTCSLACAAFGAETCINFDDAKAGTLPKSWQSAETGVGKAHWSVERDESAPSPDHVLKQSGEAEFPVCIYQKTELADGFVEAKFKLIDGKEDQAGGIIFRVKNSNNYYIARANALEDSVVLFHTLNGNRQEIKTADIKVTAQKWHKLRAEFRGSQITIFYDGKSVIKTEDSALTGPGKLGLWTKSDSVTVFDDFCFGDLE
jgi:hypothetical protein